MKVLNGADLQKFPQSSHITVIPSAPHRESWSSCIIVDSIYGSRQVTGGGERPLLFDPGKQRCLIGRQLWHSPKPVRVVMRLPLWSSPRRLLFPEITAGSEELHIASVVPAQSAAAGLGCCHGWSSTCVEEGCSSPLTAGWFRKGCSRPAKCVV